MEYIFLNRTHANFYFESLENKKHLLFRKILEINNSGRVINSTIEAFKIRETRLNLRQCAYNNIFRNPRTKNKQKRASMNPSATLYLNNYATESLALGLKNAKQGQFLIKNHVVKISIGIF